MRIFIAFPLPSSIQKTVTACQNRLKELNPKLPIRWTKKEQLHVTLLFLGEMEKKQIDLLGNSLQTIITEYEPLAFWLSSLDGFPSALKPHILTIRLGEEKEQGEKVNRRLLTLLAENGLIMANHPWRPHITLGRIRRKLPAPIRMPPEGIEKKAWLATEIILFESKLGAEGPTYIPLARYPFGPVPTTTIK